MKNILGLDLGTNSIGWAVVSTDNNDNLQKIECLGSRSIPMDADEMGKFNSGNTISKTANRTFLRGARRLKERFLLRRERLHRVLNILGFLPQHYAMQIGWNRNEPKWFGKFICNKEPKLAWQEVMVDGKTRYDFIFMNSFEEMLSDFAKSQPGLVSDKRKIPLDWTIYYLRKKALTEKITKEELAWLILNFNQKRGYYQLRGEDDGDSLMPSKTRQYFDRQIVKSITDTGEKYKDLKVILVELENGNIGKIFKKELPKWIGLEKDIIATVDIDSNGNDKFDDNGMLSQRFKIPTEAEWETEWKLIKLKTEADLFKSHKTVGAYIYDTILQNPNQKVRGKLVRTIERKFYREELERILQKQVEFHCELSDRKLYDDCIKELYLNNENHRNDIACYSFTNLFIRDIIFYQRPLKSKKSLISDCPFESYIYKKKDETALLQNPIKCIAKSNPLFQEFRLWKFISNLKIYQREKEVNGKLRTDVDVTSEFLKGEDDYVALYEWLNERKEIKQDVLLGSYFKIKKLKKEDYPYRWNYVEDKFYPCNETHAAIIKRIKEANISTEVLSLIGIRSLEESYKRVSNNSEETDNKRCAADLKSYIAKAEQDLFRARENSCYAAQIGEKELWHILFSVEDKYEIKKALRRFAWKYELSEEFAKAFENTPPFEKEYGSFSEKAIKKLLGLMRIGKYWSETSIDCATRERIQKIIDGEVDIKISDRVRENAINLTEISHFKALPEWLACYIVYNKSSEAKEVVKWDTPEDLDTYIKSFKQYSLHNPVVERVILEALRTVRDIWKKTGQIDEIHVELGREMKNPADKRKKLTMQTLGNENNNMRIKAMLMEFCKPEYKIDNVRPYSPMQQDILKIYEEYAVDNLTDDDSEFEFVSKISKTAQPSKSDILRYKLWLEQRYKSPYTGDIIPLGKLFTTAYEIEHVIPKSRFYDDSFSNKVICEAEVNKLKDNCLGYEFIRDHHGEKVYLSYLKKTVEIVSVKGYEDFVKEHYKRNASKMKKLLIDDIPEKFIERQMNDTRYISKEIKRLLSNIVRRKDENGEYEQEAVSVNLISVTGAITSILKQDWGLNDKWNELILPRFKRLNELTKENDELRNKFVGLNTQGHEIPAIPFKLQKGFSKKRIDHRHHAMDALVIACATREHVQYLNNENAKSQKYHLQRVLAKKLRRFEDAEVTKMVKDESGRWMIGGQKRKIEVAKEFYKPWNTFPYDAKAALDNIIVSFKQDLRVINKTVNKYESYKDENGTFKIGKEGAPEKSIISR